MSDIADLKNWIRQEVERGVRSLMQPPRHGLISAYNPNGASGAVVKVQFPEDLQFDGTPKQTRWIPWKSLSGGSGWTASFAPVLGMQTTVYFGNGESNSAYAMGCVHSSTQPPPSPGVPEGEMWLLHQNGSCVKITTDGTIYIGDSTGTFQRLATELFVLTTYNEHTHLYTPGSDPPTQTASPTLQVPSDSTTDLTVQLKAT